MLLVAGITEFGRIFEVYTATDRLAAAYAFSWAYCPDSNGSCGTELSTYTNPIAISNVVPQLTLANLSLTMAEYSVIDVAGVIGAPILVYQGGYQSQPTDLAATAVAAATYTVATAQPNSTQYVVVAIATYQHSISFFSYLMTPYLSSYLRPTYTVAQIKNN